MKPVWNQFIAVGCYTKTGVRNGWEEDVESSTMASQVYHIQQHGHGNPRTADGCASKLERAELGGAGPLTAAPICCT